MVVFISHFILAFAPQRHGYLPGAIEGGSLMGTPLFLLANGSAAVALFFVLSGYVLSYGFFKDQRKSIPKAVIKRWPRLVPIALVSVLYSYVSIRFNFYQYLAAAEITHSDWMKHFAYAGHDNIQDATFFGAITQGAFFAFFRGKGDAWMNSSLWTMHLELVGSFMVYGLVAAIRRAPRSEALCVLALVGIVSYFANAYLPLFFMGAGLAYLHHGGYVRGISNRLLTVASLIGILLGLAYMNPGNGMYRVFNKLGEYEGDIRILIHGIASGLLIHIAVTSPGVCATLSKRWLKFLGHVSFPLYAIHVPIIFSFSSAIFLFGCERFGYRSAFGVTLIATASAVLLVSHFLGNADRVWCKILGSRPPKPYQSPAPVSAEMSATGRK